MYIHPDVARWVLFLSVFCNIFCFFMYLYDPEMPLCTTLTFLVKCVHFTHLVLVVFTWWLSPLRKDLRPNIINNFLFSLFSVFFWNGICSAFSWRLWIKIVEVMYAYNYFRLWIFCLRIFAMKHQYVSFFLYFFNYRCLISLLLWFTYTIFDFLIFFSDYLLSNNHVNSIIVHKFDFSDEEVMAYYISFLKTLSFRLNKHTIHFFYNEVSFCRDSNFVF